jgi:acetyl-CoA decarbonylase/synthase complex subunit delta
MDLSYKIKQKIRETNFRGLGGNSALSFMTENENSAKPLYALEIPYHFDSSYPEVLRNFDTIEEALKAADNSDADLISIKFNASDYEIPKIKDFLAKLPEYTQKPLILRGANNNEIDRKLLPLLSEFAPYESIIAFADEQTYEDIVPSVIEHGHTLVLRTPIDINLAKELNILSSDKGLPLERILIDPDMGGLGYGLDYGYSIIERIRQAAFEGDEMLNVPIIAFIGEESYRAKEAKSDSFPQDWGKYTDRAAMWEIAGASAIASAGADIVVVWNVQSIKTLKEVL